MANMIRICLLGVLFVLAWVFSFFGYSVGVILAFAIGLVSEAYFHYKMNSFSKYPYTKVKH